MGTKKTEQGEIEANKSEAIKNPKQSSIKLCSFLLSSFLFSKITTTNHTAQPSQTGAPEHIRPSA